MTTLPNGAYHIYNGDKLPPIVCEIFYDYVYEAGDALPRPIGKYKGRFVRLQEVVTPPIVIELD